LAYDVLGMAKPRLIAILHRLIGRNGHRYHEALGLQEETQRRGKELLLFIHREAQPEVRAALNARAVLHDPVFRPDLTFDERTADFVAMLHRHVDPVVRPDDWLLQLLTTQCEARATARWLAELPARRRPWALVLFVSDRWNRVGEADRLRQLAELRLLGHELAALPAGARHRLLFACHTSGLQEELQAVLGGELMLAPTTDYATGIAPRPAARLDSVPRLALLGGARREKGSHLLPAVVPLCLADGGLEIVLHLCNELLTPEEFAPLAELGKLPGVHTVSGAVDRNAYLALLAAADLLLLPYERVAYRLRPSGIFSEAVMAGLPLVVPDGTAMAEQIAAGAAAGVIYESEGAVAIAAAVRRALDELPGLSAVARERAVAWPRSNSLGAFLDWVETAIARRAAAPPTEAIAPPPSLGERATSLLRRLAGR